MINTDWFGFLLVTCYIYVTVDHVDHNSFQVFCKSIYWDLIHFFFSTLMAKGKTGLTCIPLSPALLFSLSPPLPLSSSPSEVAELELDLDLDEGPLRPMLCCPDDLQPLSPLFQRSVSEDSAGSSASASDNAKTRSAHSIVCVCVWIMTCLLCQI